LGRCGLSTAHPAGDVSDHLSRGAMMRRVAVWTSVLAVLVSALLPPTHIHLAEHNHDHQHDAVEHAHWSPHAAPSRLALDDDDGRAIFIDRPATTADAF